MQQRHSNSRFGGRRGGGGEEGNRDEKFHNELGTLHDYEVSYV